MIFQAWVTREGTTDLELTASPYKLEEKGLDLGAVAMRWNWVDSPFVHGSFAVNTTRDQAQLNMGIRVVGSDQDGLQTNIGALIAAFTQFEYQVKLRYDGADYRWKCWAADYAVGVEDDRMDLLNTWVRFVIPRYPVPEEGPI